MRFAVEVVRAVRERVGNDSLLSTVCRCSTWSKAAVLLRNGRAGAGHRSGGRDHYQHRIGWHEARIPTIATPVPRGALAGSRAN